jgi:hypothetical protein
MNATNFPYQVQALSDRAKTGMLIAAEQGRSEGFHFWRGNLAALQSMTTGYGVGFAKSDRLLGGYQAPTDLKAAWAALPERAEKLTMAEVQQILAAQGVQVAAQPVANGDVNAGQQLENSAVATVNLHDEHAPAVVDFDNSSCVHDGARLDESRIVAQRQNGGAA